MAKRLKGLGQVLKNFDETPVMETDMLGQPVGTIGAKKLLTTVLGRGASDDPIRAIDVGMKIHNANEHLVLDDADVELVKQVVKADRSLSNLAKAFLLRLLEEAKPVDGKGQGE